MIFNDNNARYDIIFPNGKSIKNLMLNGSNFVSEKKIIKTIIPEGIFDLKIKKIGSNAEVKKIVRWNSEAFAPRGEEEKWICFDFLTEKEIEEISEKENANHMAQELLDAQLALCDIYETMIKGGAK